MMKRSSLKKLVRERVQQYKEIIDQLYLDAVKKKQLHNDFINFIAIIEKLSRRNLLLNDISNVAVIILSALVPIIIHITPAKNNGKYDTTYLDIATVLSVILAILNGLRQSYKFRERWQNYWETAERLILEGQSYFALSGKYTAFDTHEIAFKKFIDSINALRTKQIDAYVSQLMTVNDKEIEKSITDEINVRNTVISEVREKVQQQSAITDELNVYVKNDPKISYYLVDYNHQLITFYTFDNNYTLPDKFNFKTSGLNELVYRVSTRFGNAVIHSRLGPSSGIKNQDTEPGYGSISCFCTAEDGSQVFVTCYHVVKHESQSWDKFVHNEHDGVINTDGEYIGFIKAGEKTSELDTALVGVVGGVDTEVLLPGGVKVSNSIYIDQSNFNNYQNVYMISRQRNFQKIQGRLSAVNQHITLNYGTALNRDDKDLEKLMIITYVSTEPFSVPGDSGSLVFASDGTAIGIVVGGDGIQASFVIPFSTIQDRFNLKLL